MKEKYSFDVGDFSSQLEKIQSETKKVRTPITAADVRFEFQPNKDSFTRIAFDLFESKEKEEESADLWRLQADADGKEWLVRQVASEERTVQAASKWSALIDESGTSITLAFEEEPLLRFAAKDFGFVPKTAKRFKDFLLEKVSDPAFLQKIAQETKSHQRQK